MTGNSKIDKIIFLLASIIALASAALVFYSHNMIEKPQTDESAEFNSMAKELVTNLNIPKVSLEEISINLYSRKTRLRFLNIKMDLELFENGMQEKLKGLTPIVNDQLIDIAGNMKAAELNSVTGKILLESRIKKRLNKLLGANIIKKIYFSKFIIQ